MSKETQEEEVTLGKLIYLDKFIREWEIPSMDLSYEVLPDSDPDYQYGQVDDIVQEMFLRDFWEMYGEEIGEYDQWKDYINNYFSENKEDKILDYEFQIQQYVNYPDDSEEYV